MPSFVTREPSADALHFGRLVDVQTRGIGQRLLYEGERNSVVFGANGSGKGMRVLVPNLLQSVDRSIFVLDIKGELAAITAPFRRRLGRVVVINPFGVLTDREGFDDLESDGFNPLASLDPPSPSFNSDVALMAEAMMPVSGREPHFDESARALGSMFMMKTVMEARQWGSVPSMTRFRQLLCTPSAAPMPPDYQPIGIPKYAMDLAASPHAGLRNKAGQFVEWNKEKIGIASTAMRHTESFDDPQIADDMEKGDFDFAEMKERITTVYVILPPEMLERHTRWLRLLLTCAMRAVLRPREPGEPRVLFMLDEYAALAKGGLSLIENTWALVRGYGVQIMPVLQDLNQLQKLYSKGWETFIANAGVVSSFAPNDPTSAEWLSKRAGDTTCVVVSYSTSGQPNSLNQNVSYQQTKVPFISPHRLYGMGDGFMLLAAAGLSNVVPAYAPGYWQIQECVERARINPYYHPVPRQRFG